MVLDKIKALFRRWKSVAKVSEEKPPDVVEAKPPEAIGEKPGKTTEPQKKVPKASRKKGGKRKRAS